MCRYTASSLKYPSRFVDIEGIYELRADGVIDFGKNCQRDVRMIIFSVDSLALNA